MTEEQQAAYIQSQIACALIEMEGMKAANIARERHDFTLAYSEADFMALLEQYDIDHNSVVGLFRGIT